MKFRFNITDENGDSVHSTDWVEEQVGQGMHHALDVLNVVRQQFPGLRYSIERTDVPPPPKEQLFRYDVAVKDARIPVVDNDGTHYRKVTNGVIHTRSFTEAEREKVIAEVRALAPDGILREVKVG